MLIHSHLTQGQPKPFRTSFPPVDTLSLPGPRSPFYLKSPVTSPPVGGFKTPSWCPWGALAGAGAGRFRVQRGAEGLVGARKPLTVLLTCAHHAEWPGRAGAAGSILRSLSCPQPQGTAAGSTTKAPAGRRGAVSQGGGGSVTVTTPPGSLPVTGSKQGRARFCLMGCRREGPDPLATRSFHPAAPPPADARSPCTPARR